MIGTGGVSVPGFRWTSVSGLIAGLLVTSFSCSTMTDADSLAAARISEEALRSHVRFLSDDLLEGRGPGTRGDELTRLYLSSRMEALGLQPGGVDGSWEQPFDIVGLTTEAPDVWSFQASSGEVHLEAKDDFIAVSGVQADSASIENAEVVFVGYGIEAPEFQWNDYKDADLDGKVLLMLNNDPDWDPDLFRGSRRLYYGRWTYKYESAARVGAAGAIVIHTTASAGYPWQVVRTSWSGEQFELPARDEPRISVAAWVTEDAATRLCAAAGRDLGRLVESARRRDFRPVSLGILTSLKLKVHRSEVKTANVLGLLPGRDPELEKEVVVYTAHHDHLGRTGSGDDTIYNGALDNAAGTAQVLAIADALAALPLRPRRSSLFLFVAAEEQGLLGSEFYASHPTFAPGRIAADINLDGGNIWGRTGDVTLIGYDKSSLRAVVETEAARQGRRVYPDQFPDRGYYYRSDQFSFAKIGVPAIYLKTGVQFLDQPEGWGKERMEAWVATHYHQPSDELTPGWNFQGLVEDAVLGFRCGLAVAEDDLLPTWVPGDEFEEARRKAIDEVRE